MIPYLILILFPVLFPLVYYRPKRGGASLLTEGLVEKRTEMAVALFFLGLFAMLALRDITVGIDLVEYKKIFVECGKTSFTGLSKLRWEIGYTIFNKLCYTISKEYRILLIAVAIITIVPIYQLYSREKKNSFLLIVLFVNMPCFVIVFSGLRQAIAVSIGVIAYMAIEEKKHFRGVLLILLASTFHMSAFILLLLFPAFYWKIKVRDLIYIIPAMAAIYVVRKPLLSFIISFLPEKYIEFYGEIRDTGAYGMMILFLIFSAFSFVVLNEESMTQSDYCMRNILLIATVLQLFVPIHGLIQRASYYFLIFVPVALLTVVRVPSRQWKEISNIAIVIMSGFFFIFFFYTAIFSDNNLLDVFPYKFFWSGRGW